MNGENTRDFENNETVLIGRKEIEKLISMKDAVEIVDKTFQDMGKGKTIVPTKLTLDLGETAAYPPYEGFMNAMPAYIGWQDIAGLKWVGGFLGERRKRGLPFIVGMILLVDPHLGNFTAVLDGAYITNLRTGAQTAVALKYLHKGKSIRIGLYGAGMQGHTQTLAIAQLFDIEEVRVYDVRKEACLKYKEDMKNIVKGEIIIAEKPEDAAIGDAVICVTQAKDAFVKDNWIKSGTILFPMGSYQECEDAFILNADRIIVDHIGQSLHRGALKSLNAQGKITEKNISCTIGEMAAGLTSGRMSEKERVLCIPIGTGAMDVAIAQVAFERAQQENLGGRYDFT
jgi:ornithine cyclodeaminase/alanine dehydrogenase